jgi:hypothetical protein
MRLAWFGLLALSVTVAGCGRGSSASNLNVTCGGQTLLVGAKYVDVIVDAASKTTVLSFPNPINEDQTQTMLVQRKCTVSPGGDK